MFYSVLFPEITQYEDFMRREIEAPPYLGDLGLDLVLGPLLHANADYGLERYLYDALQDTTVIRYRQEVMGELEDPEYRRMLTAFSKEVFFLGRSMEAIRKRLHAEEERSRGHLERGRMLEYAERYCGAIDALRRGLAERGARSAGMQGLLQYLEGYMDSEEYQGLLSEVSALRAAFSAVEYSMLIRSGTIRVRRYEGEKDYSKQILATFEKFRQGDVKDYRHTHTEEPVADHVEEAVLHLVSRQHKETFQMLEDFCTRFHRFEDGDLLRFSKEIRFYLSWMDVVTPLKAKGLPFHYPRMVHSKKALHARACYDIALAAKDGKAVVTNDFHMEEPECVLVITGPNQGGKTTYARMFGQVHHLGALGLCVPGEESTLMVFDSIHTHFGKEEDLSTQEGKLQDDLVRLHRILTTATERSLIIINEIFTSTTLEDAVMLGRRMMEKIIGLRAPTVVVTFLDELATFDEAVVSMMSTVKEEDPLIRTYKILRKPPDGLAYAMHIAKKHHLTYEALRRRLER